MKGSAIRTMIFLIMIISAGAVSAGDSVDCAYRAKTDKRDRPASIMEYKNCGNIVNGKVSLSEKHLQRIDFDSHWLAAVFVQGRHYYVKRDGSMLPVVTFDNWADDYSEGLVRSAVDGKIAFYDRSFRQIVAPRYDWAAPFKDGRALVCKGCKAEPPDDNGHVPITGGTWGYINRKGEEIVPVQHTREEADRLGL